MDRNFDKRPGSEVYRLRFDYCVLAFVTAASVVFRRPGLRNIRAQTLDVTG
jgi:hypothetical protein